MPVTNALNQNTENLVKDLIKKHQSGINFRNVDLIGDETLLNETDNILIESIDEIKKFHFQNFMRIYMKDFQRVLNILLQVF